LPGHIDTLWGAFFASGDGVYVNEIINVLFMASLPRSETVSIPAGHKMQDVLAENKKLAENTLRRYALGHEAVRRIITERMDKEKNVTKKKMLRSLLPSMTFPEEN
jgi:hypothetical protein